MLSTLCRVSLQNNLQSSYLYRISRTLRTFQGQKYGINIWSHRHSSTLTENRRSYCGSNATIPDPNQYLPDIPPKTVDEPLTHKSAVDLLEQTGMIKSVRAANIFRSTDPALFSYAKTEEIPQNEEEKETFVDHWLHSSLAITGIITVLDGEVEVGSSVLEIGSGTGYMTCIFCKMVAPSGRVVAVDIDPEATRDAQQTMKNHFPEYMTVIEWRVGDVFEMDWTKDVAKYDVIYFGGGISEVNHRWFSMVKPGGSIIAAIPEIEPETTETHFMLKKFLLQTDGQVKPLNLMFVDYDALKEPEFNL